MLRGEHDLKPRILIAGANGFIGSCLGYYLGKAGYEITLGSRRQIINPELNSLCNQFLLDWNNDSELKNKLKGFNVVIHAGGMNFKECQADPLAALEFNGYSTERLLKAACTVGVDKFIYFSSAHVYSNPLSGRITEESLPMNSHPYATSHLIGEHAVLNACKKGQIQGVVLRLSNSFGIPIFKDGKCWNLLVNDLCKQAVINKKMVLNSGGMQLRDFIGIDQVCNIVEYLLNLNGIKNSTGIFNIGTGTALSVLSMAQIIQKNCELILKYKPDLICNQGSEDEINSDLLYESIRLKNIGIKQDSEKNYIEIVKLLKYCKKTF